MRLMLCRMPLLSEHLLVLLVLVLPALVRVENQLLSPSGYGFKRLLQHGSYHAQNRSVRDGIADQITVVQIQNWREIQLLTKQTELCHIGDPLLVWLFGIEVPVQQIWRNFAHFSLVRTIFLDSDTANQAQFLHKPLDSLVVQEKSSAVKCHCDTPVSVSSFVFVVDSGDFCFCFLIFVCSLHPLQMVVEGRTRQLSDCRAEATKRYFMPQFLNYLRFLRWRRSSSKTKACKFFRYSFSARSRCTSASKSSSTSLWQFLRPACALHALVVLLQSLPALLSR